MFCVKCGKELKEGEICNCEKVEKNVSQKENENKEENVSQEEMISKESSQNENDKKAKNGKVNASQQQKKLKNSGSNNLLKNFGMLFVKPVEAIRDAVKNSRWVNGIVYVLILSVILSLYSTFSVALSSIKVYNVAVTSAQTRYDEAKESYRASSSLISKYKRNLDNAKEERVEYLFSLRFALKLVGNFAKVFISSVLTILFVTLLLFAIGKLLKGKGTFGQVFAGVGLAYNVQYISAFILPVISNLPIISVISVISSSVIIIYGILLFLVFREAFELDDNKNIFSVFIALAIPALVSKVILNVITFISKFISSL